jgi:hypothetical protein
VTVVIQVHLLLVGKVLYAQHTEILNPTLNRGLPPDCAAGEPNLDYGLKSSDLACAAYLSGEITGILDGPILILIIDRTRFCLWLVPAIRKFDRAPQSVHQLHGLGFGALCKREH